MVTPLIILTHDQSLHMMFPPLPTKGSLHIHHCPHPCHCHRHSLVGCCVIFRMDTSLSSSSSLSLYHSCPHPHPVSVIIIILVSWLRLWNIKYLALVGQKISRSGTGPDLDNLLNGITNANETINDTNGIHDDDQESDTAKKQCENELYQLLLGTKFEMKINNVESKVYNCPLSW